MKAAITLLVYLINFVNSQTFTIRSLSSSDPIFYSEPIDSSGSSHVIRLIANGSVSVSISDIPSESNWGFIVFQAHAQWKTVLMSSPRAGLANSTNAALVEYLKATDKEASVQVMNPDRHRNISLLIIAIPYSAQIPVPGACNMEFEPEVAPYLRVSYEGPKTVLEYQRAQIGTYKSLPFYSCDLSNSLLQYDVYHYFGPEKDLSEDFYFSALSLMSRVSTIGRHAIQSHSENRPSTRLQFPSFPGTGTFFTIMVRKNNNLIAAYAPIATYSCNDPAFCAPYIRPVAWVLCTFMALFGAFLCFVGHRFFGTEMFSFGFTSIALVTYILLSRFSDASYTNITVGTILLGILGGVIWFVVWWFLGSPVISLIIPGLNLGFLISAVIFFTPFGNLELFQNDFNFWMSYSCILLVPAIILLPFTHKLSILCCAVIGSYAVVILIDLYVGSNLHMILMGVIQRAAMPKYNNIMDIDVPFQTSDWILVAFWIFLAFLGTAVQILRERSRSPFPPPPYLTHKARRTTKRLSATVYDDDELDDETRALLGPTAAAGGESSAARPSTSYGTAD